MAVLTREPRYRQPPPPKPRPVLTNRSFLLLWLAQLISQSAQNAILFTLLVIVTKLTKGSTYTSMLVLSFVIPSVVFGVFSGVLVDLWSKRLLLIYTNVARGLLAICFLFSRDHVLLLILISIFFATSSQVFGTTDAVTVPSVVPKEPADGGEQHVQHGRHRLPAHRHDLPGADPAADAGRSVALPALRR